MKAIIFPGQGAQLRGMGKDLFAEFPDYVERADRILGYSVAELCLNEADKRLNQTEYTQPALYTVGALAYLNAQRDATDVAYFAGHSLGEYNALFAAGVFDFETGLLMVKQRGALMAQATDGGMAAIVGLATSQVQQAFNDLGVDTVDIANVNSPQQMVISGPKQDLLHTQPRLEQLGGRFILLNVSAAFHSRYMRNAAEQFASFLARSQGQGEGECIEFAVPNTPVIANRTAKPYQPQDTARLLVEQIQSPVLWADSIRFLLSKGVSEFVELSPQPVLTKFTNAIQDDYSTSEPVDSGVTKKNDAAYRAHQASKPIASASSATPPLTNSGVLSSSTLQSNAPQPSVKLGNQDFCDEYNLKHAYVTGSMYRGIASKELVVRMAQSGYFSFYGSGGMPLDEIAEDLAFIQSRLAGKRHFGANLLCNLNDPSAEHQLVELYLQQAVTCIEASAYVMMTRPLVQYRLSGLRRQADGSVRPKNRVFAKISRAEIAKLFLSPPPKKMVEQLLQQRLITAQEASLAEHIIMADELIVEADSGGHTDAGRLISLLPSMIRLRHTMCAAHPSIEPVIKQAIKKVRVGAAGGMGSPEAIATAFFLGADFVVTGSINQCTVESGTSTAVKDILQSINEHDTAYAPAGDMFEMGSRVQVVQKGTLFANRANKLYALWLHYDAIDDLPEETQKTIQYTYFRRSFADIWVEAQARYADKNPSLLEKAKRDPKAKMALIFRWYFAMTSRAARLGDSDEIINYQIHCGPAMGSLNAWLESKQSLQRWQDRHVDTLADALMDDAVGVMKHRLTGCISS